MPMNTRLRATWTTALIGLIAASGLKAHHSLALFDTSTPLWIQGTIVEFARVNPHSLIFLDQRQDDGQIHRWAIDGPAAGRLVTMGVGSEILRTGDVIEVCGFATREGTLSQRAAPGPNGAEPTATSPRGQALNGILLVLADGQKRVWSDYGHLRQCLRDEEREALPRQ